ncbi:hypothetical protein GCM10007971_22550 [Oceanobacillus indicireducens]|uniref:Uncharacterized protein n=2 Tax=Oceanobacillus indicireducens TaxID=1004261 RepID=A0A918D2N1_9BACI|nr:hypothetical protein GCM10007971_22550 [Oceanobacillus indicireducens]
MKDDEITTIIDKGALERLLSQTYFLVGYNNYSMDDKLLASILKGMDPYDSLQKIIGKKRFTLNLQNPISIDLKQELPDLDLKEIQANLSYDITNTDIETDLKTMQFIFSEREDYFTSKFEVVKEFKLPASSLKKTRVNLASDVLKSRKGKDADRLKLTFDKQLTVTELPKPVIDFYQDIQKQFRGGRDFKDLEKQKFTFKLAGLDHIYGFGGLHAAKNNYASEGHFMQIDVKSYYPSLILNNGFLTGEALGRYKAIYSTRRELQNQEDNKEQAYKLITNIVYGGLKSKWTNLYNPQAANNVVVNGQLILTHLILLLENFCELIQTNTDGLIIKYEPVMKESILKIVKLFEQHYSLEFEIDYIKQIAQRDVNNYVIKYDDDTLHARGRFANHEGGNYERNSLTIIDKALVDYYMDGIKPNRTVLNEWRANRLERFQNVVRAGKFDGMAHEMKEDTLLEGTYTSHFEKLPDVNRVFASRDKYAGSIYKTKKGAETKYTKVPYTSENCLVWNESLDKLNKRHIDLNWYIKEIEGWIF